MLATMELLKSERRSLQKKITEVIRGRLREYREGTGGQIRHTGQEIAKRYHLTANRQTELLNPKKYHTVISWPTIGKLLAEGFIVVEDIVKNADLTDKERLYVESAYGLAGNPDFQDVVATLKSKGWSNTDIIKNLKKNI